MDGWEKERQIDESTDWLTVYTHAGGLVLGTEFRADPPFLRTHVYGTQ